MDTAQPLSKAATVNVTSAQRNNNGALWFQQAS
jgi:hypothetical protein